MAIIAIQTTYDVRIPDTQDKSGEVKHALAQTQKLAFEQLDWLVEHINEEWAVIGQLNSTDKQLSAAEKLFHQTKKNPPT